MLLLRSVVSLMWKPGHLDAGAENRAGTVGPLLSMSSAFSLWMTDTCFSSSIHHGKHTRIGISIFAGTLIGITNPQDPKYKYVPLNSPVRIRTKCLDLLKITKKSLFRRDLCTRINVVYVCTVYRVYSVSTDKHPSQLFKNVHAC